MGLMEQIRERILNWLLPSEYYDTAKRERLENMSLWRAYYDGLYRKQLKVRPLQADDNVGLNFIGLVVDRSISMLLGNGIEFDMGEDTGNQPGQQVNTPIQDYIDGVWEANKSSILLHKALQYACITGTGFLKILPGALEYSGNFYPRLIALDPMWMSIETADEDIEAVNAYQIQYKITRNGQEVNKRERTERQVSPDGSTVNWLVREFETDRNGRWVLLNENVWDYEFAPITHWQNLPQPSSAWGQSDIENIIEIQDRVNFVASNISKIIRYHAHPKTWGASMGTQGKQSWGADEMLTFSDPNAKLANLEMQSDLASSRAYLMELRQAMFDIARTVGLNSLQSKLGALTDFQMRVVYQDALAKNGTKQELMGEMLEDVNHRLLVLADIPHDGGGTVIWPDPLPEDAVAESTALAQDINLGLVSKQTAALERGYDYEQEQERIQNEKSQGENIGSQLLAAFNKGQ